MITMYILGKGECGSIYFDLAGALFDFIRVILTWLAALMHVHVCTLTSTNIHKMSLSHVVARDIRTPDYTFSQLGRKTHLVKSASEMCTILYSKHKYMYIQVMSGLQY